MLLPHCQCSEMLHAVAYVQLFQASPVQLVVRCFHTDSCCQCLSGCVIDVLLLLLLLLL